MWHFLLMLVLFIAVVVLVFILRSTTTPDHGFQYILNTTLQYIPNTILVTNAGWTVDGTTFNANVQKKLDDIYVAQRYNEFGPERYAILFMPGVYDVHVKVGYYTSIIGLGKTPDQVTLTNVEVEDGRNGTALTNFWRSCENVTISPGEGVDVFWRVSQASPLDQVRVPGNLRFSSTDGYSSGGFMSNSVVGNICYNGTQQQWLNLNCSFKLWQDTNWNQVGVGCVGAIADHVQACIDPEGSYTMVGRTPKFVAKPYLFYEDDQYFIMRADCTDGASRGPIVGQGTKIPLDDFFIARPQDGAQKINQALSAGKHLFLTPGIYVLDQPLVVVKDGQMVFGSGMATLQPNSTQPAMIVSSRGARLTNLLFDAGTVGTSVLLQIGAENNSSTTQGSPTDPTVLHNVFGRVGGWNNKCQTDTMVRIYQDYVIGFNVWLWRADHDITGKYGGLGTDQAICQHGLIVDGANVQMYGLFVEHTLREQIIWNGESGSIYLMQSELPYDVDSTWNYPSLKISDNITSFFGVGLGVYCYFKPKFSVKGAQGPRVSSAIECPKNQTDVVVYNACTVALSTFGGITHIVNETGDDTGTDVVARWCSWNSDHCDVHN